MHVITLCKHKNAFAIVSFLLPSYCSVTKPSLWTAIGMLTMYPVVEM